MKRRIFEMTMFVQTVLVIVLFSVACSAREECRFWRCESDFYSKKPSTLNHGDCVNKVTGLERCLQDSVKADDVCQSCKKWEFNTFTYKNYRQIKINKYCFVKQCKKNDIRACLQAHLKNIILFYDTLIIDDFISCIDNWSPEMDQTVCLNALFFVTFPDDMDTIAVGKQLLTDIKQGCDPVMPAVKCRHHLAPVRQQWPPKSTYQAYRKSGIQAIQNTLSCMQTTVKKYPCKTLEGLLSSDVTRNVIEKYLVLKYLGVNNNWEGNRSHEERCGNATDFTSFLRQ